MKTLSSVSLQTNSLKKHNIILYQEHTGYNVYVLVALPFWNWEKLIKKYRLLAHKVITYQLYEKTTTIELFLYSHPIYFIIIKIIWVDFLNKKLHGVINSPGIRYKHFNITMLSNKCLLLFACRGNTMSTFKNSL